MRVKFLRTEVVPQNAGDIVYRQGEIHDLRDDQVARWLRRGAVVVVGAKSGKAPAKDAPKPAADTDPA